MAENPATEIPWYNKPVDPVASSRGFGNPRRRLSEVSADTLVKIQILEWFAWKIYIAQAEAECDGDYRGKSYDPMTVEINADGSGIAHSYVFDFEDGGRHHPFSSLEELETMLTNELVGIAKHDES